MAENNISLHIGMSGMPAVLAQMSQLNQSMAKSHSTLMKVNTGMFQVATVLGSFSTLGISKEFEQMTLAALAATNAITAVTNAAMMSAKSLRGTLWGIVIVLGSIAAMEAINLWQSRKKEAEAARELAEANESLADELLRVIEARRAEGKINTEKRAALVAAIPNAFDRGLMDQNTLANHLQQVQLEMKAAGLLDMTKEEFNLQKEKLEILFDQHQLLADQMRQKIESNKATAEDVKNYREMLLTLDKILVRQDKHSEKGVNAGFISSLQGDKSFVASEKKRDGLRQSGKSVTDPNSLREQMTFTFDQLEKQFGTMAQMVARGFTSIIGSAVDGIANSIMGLLNLTMTWGEALRNIGMSIVQGIIESFSRMVSEWIVTHLIMKGVLWAFHLFGRMLKRSETQETIAAETAKTPALGLNAVLSGISSYGTAAIVGLALVMAAIAAVSSFATGGYTGDGGKFEAAGIVHRGEFVIPKEDVQRIGVSNIESMVESGGTHAAGGQSQKITAMFVWNEEQMQNKIINSPSNERFIRGVIDRYRA
jgi:hypothetical protein